MQDPLKDLLDEQDKYEAKIAKGERKKREAAEAVRKLKRKAASERKAAERKARDHALIVLGAIVAAAISGGQKGDWETVDYKAVRDFVGTADFRAYARNELRAPELEPAAAALRLRTWEQTGQWVPEPGPDDAGGAGAR